ncbi:MAG TPA: hypothetical protein VFV87_06310 [Pirellulaceae bacterium]|nr:hypothetical protein [Pirellulaceae bacterium]
MTDELRTSEKAGNRLTVGLLLLWMLAASCLFGIHTSDGLRYADQVRSMWTPDGLAEQTQRQIGRFFTIVDVSGWIVLPVYAVGLAGAFLLVWRRFRRGPPFPSQAGHFVLITSGVFALSTEIWWAVWSSPRVQGDGAYYGTWHATIERWQFVPYALAFASIATALAFGHIPWKWRTVLGLGTTAMGLFIVGSLMRADVIDVRPYSLYDLVEWPAKFVLAIAFLMSMAIAIAEVRSGPCHDFLHYAGFVVAPTLPLRLIALQFTANHFLT